MVAASTRITFIIDDEHECMARRRVTARCRCVSIHAAETRLPDQLPGPTGIHHDALARRKQRCISNGIGTRRLLHRLLLGVDGPAFRRRRDEHSLDRRADTPRLFGENAAGAYASKFRHWIIAMWVGRLHSFSPVTVSSRSANNDEPGHKSWPRALDGVCHVLGNFVAVDFGIRAFRRGPGGRFEK